MLISKFFKSWLLSLVLIMLAGLKSFAVNDYVVETFVIDATSQPPLVGAVIKSGDVSKITAKGFVVTTDKTKYALEDAVGIDDRPIECTNYDCSTFNGREFTCRVRHLKGNTKYYIYSYVVTDKDVHYGDAVEITSGNFNRWNGKFDYANVYHATSNTLFDLVTDEIIDGGFYYSNNESSNNCGYTTNRSISPYYKFKTEFNYKLWRYNNWCYWRNKTVEAPSQPDMSLSAKKLTMTTDDGASIYYCINGDGLRPENFTQKYTEPIDVEYGDVVYAYSISEQGYPSHTRAYKVLKCLDEAKDFVVETFVIDGTSQPPLVGAVVKSGDMEKVTAKGFVVTTDKTKYAVEDAIPMVAWKDWAVECASFDCTDFKGKEFTRRIVELKGNTLYYIYSYIVTDNGTYYGNPVTITSWDYNRCPDLQGYANVYYSDKYSLFDMMTDELIEGGFYHSTNENPSYCGYSTNRSNHGVYKFKTKWSYKIFYAQAKSKTPSLPEMSVSDKKLTMTTDEDASIYYCINGDGLCPENFTLKYTEPIEVEYGDVVYAYSIREQEYPSYVRAYKVLECLDDDNSSLKGQGTRENPYLIGSAAELKKFNELLENDNSLCARLTADIVLNENVLDENYNLNGDGSNFEQWAAHGIDNGYFNGAGHTISGLYINNSKEYQALFESASRIDSLGLVDSYIKARRHAGGLCSWLRHGNNIGGQIYSCYFDGVVIATSDKAGGITAHMGNTYEGGPSNKIINCYNKGKISGYNHVGGICGSAYSLTNYNEDYIENCYNVGSVFASWTDCGAICGYADNAVGSKISASASKCYYLEGSCTRKGQGYMGTAKSLDNFNDGSVCALLNNNGGKFKQRKGIDTYPILFGKAIEKYLTDNIKYENTDEIVYDFIHYTRNFSNTSWQALYIPFSMRYEDWKDDFEVAYINGVRQLDMDDDGVIDKTTMDVVKIKSGNLIPNTPYLIKAKTTGEKTLSASGVTLHKAEENSIDCRTTIAEYTFTGTYTTIPASTLIANNYYAMGGGSLIITDGTSDLKPYRWYMKIDARNPMYNVSLDAKTITINVLNEESETTGVEELRIVNDKSPVYDINGRKVNDKNLKPGIYIKNGKKFVVK